jgi:hypothetical protein
VQYPATYFLPSSRSDDGIAEPGTAAMPERSAATTAQQAEQERGITMGYAKYIGRVGALAVAPGVGAAIASTPGVAFAEGSDAGLDSSSSSSIQPNTPADHVPGGPAPRTAKRSTPLDFELLDRQRIRMDGWFRGPTW